MKRIRRDGHIEYRDRTWEEEIKSVRTFWPRPLVADDGGVDWFNHREGAPSWMRPDGRVQPRSFWNKTRHGHRWDK